MVQEGRGCLCRATAFIKLCDYRFMLVISPLGRSTEIYRKFGASLVYTVLGHTGP